MSYLCHKNVDGINKSVVAIEETDENLCAFVARIGVNERYIITDENKNMVLTTIGYFIDVCPNRELRNRLEPVLMPYQQGEDIPNIVYSED